LVHLGLRRPLQGVPGIGHGQKKFAVAVQMKFAIASAEDICPFE
jgi:hypothetical protein